jgi:hypothetical protein
MNSWSSRCRNLRSDEKQLYLVPNSNPKKCELRDVIYSFVVLAGQLAALYESQILPSFLSI